MWKGKDTKFLSNLLPEGVARTVGVPPKPASVPCANSASERNSGGTPARSSVGAGSSASGTTRTPQLVARTASSAAGASRSSSFIPSFDISLFDQDNFTNGDEENHGTGGEGRDSSDTSHIGSVGVSEARGGQSSVPSTKKRKAVEAREAHERSSAALGTAMGSSIATSLHAVLTGSPASKETRRRNEDATAQLRTAQASLITQQTEELKRRLQIQHDDIEIGRINAQLSNTNVILTEEMTSKLRARLMVLLNV